MYVGDGGGSDSLGWRVVWTHRHTLYFLATLYIMYVGDVFVASVMKNVNLMLLMKIFSETQISATMLPPLSSRFFPFLRR